MNEPETNTQSEPVTAPPPLAELVPAALMQLIEKHPAFDQLPGIIRRDLGINLPPEMERTTSAIMECMESERPVINSYCENKRKTKPAVQTGRTEISDTVTIEVEAEQEVEGHSHWTRTDSLAGRIDVPVDIMLEGSDAVIEWVKENIENIDWEREYGEETLGDSEDYGSDSEKITNERTIYRTVDSWIEANALEDDDNE